MKQLEKEGLVFMVRGADGRYTKEQLPTQDHPFVVRNLIIGDGIAKIGWNAFSLCKTLRSVYFLGEVTEIADSAFNHGVTVHDVSLIEVGFAHPETVKFIGKDAFERHRFLQSINIPQNANIHESAFYKCDNLKK